MRWRASYIAFAIVCSLAIEASAQYTSRLGRFQVDQVQGCDDLTINITILATSTCPCVIIYGDVPNNQGQSLTYTYTQPGTYLLQVLSQTVGYDDIQITVTPDLQPQFELYSCGNNRVSVNITDTNYSSYTIDYGDATPIATVPSSNPRDQHTYATGGNKSITVKGINAGALPNCTPSTRNVTAVTTLPAPTITQLQVIDNGSIQLDYNASQNILYRLEIATNNANSFQLYKTSYNLNSETLTNLRPDDNYYCFRLGAFDPCSNTTVYSNTICSANLDVAVQNDQNNVSWSTNATGATNLRLARTTSGSSVTTTVVVSPYVDTDVICGTEYCYQLTTNYPNGSRSISLQKCGTAISTDPPDAVDNITAVVGQQSLTLQWQTPVNELPSEFSVFKSAGNFYELLTKTATPQSGDESYTVESKACYKISYVNICGNQSPLSAETCPIILTGRLAKDNSVELSWTAYAGWRNGVREYVIEKYSEDGQLLQTFTPGNVLSYVDTEQDLSNQVFAYVVKANAQEAGLPQAVSNRIVIIKDPNLFYPTAFTPNGDNLNDIFNVYGQYITDFEMSIFNRWGELMYTTSDLESGWDGYYKGNLMPEGTYTFIAEISDRAGRKFKKSGSVLLLTKGK